MWLVYKTQAQQLEKEVMQCTQEAIASPKSHTSVPPLTDQNAGLRLCTKCKEMLPLDRFHPNVRRPMCIVHQRAYKLKMVLGTHNKRAFNSLRCRARQDMLMFGHRNVAIPRKLVTSLLTEDQMENFSIHCLIPKNPEQILSKDNIVVVTKFQRAYIIGHWRATRDTQQYIRDLEFILEAPQYAVLK